MSDIPKGQAASIFVSYRIKDTLQAADRLAVELRRAFGKDQVFFDRRTIEPGEIWPGRIEDAVKEAKVVLVLIGKQWLTVQDEHGYGRRRIDNHTDWVRREVEEALTIMGRVVPVLVDDASPVPAAALVDLPNMAKLASCHGAKLRTEDWDSDFNALVNLLKSKGLLVLAQQGDSGQNVDQARQAEQLISSYQLAIQQRWQELWSGDGTSNKPPFIDTQGLRLLLETNRPEQYLHPAYFRVGRGTRASMAEQDLGDWVEVDRNELAANELTVDGESRVDLSRLVITTDAGVGKTTTMQWLEAELNRPGAATVAFHLTFSHVPAHLDELLCELARRLLQKRQRDGESVNLLTQDDAVRIIESLRDEGRLVLILDALDQEPADGSAAILVGELLQDSSWKRCRIVISGRPHALQRHWQALFASHLGWGWRFVQVDEFTPDQQRQFLGVDQRGKNRLELIPQEAREILSTPRVLSYLRKLTDAELRKIRTAGDVYWHSVQHLLIEGMQGSEAARRIGLKSGEPTPEKVQARSKQRALKLLAGLAFEMTSMSIPGGDGELAETPSIPNFDGVPSGRFPRFRQQLQKRLLADDSLDRDLDGLAALNEFISQGFFDTTVEGLQEVYWRNRTLQEFFTALWLSQYCTDVDAKQLWNWLHLPDRPETEEYYWVWRFVCEMHSNSRDPKSWLRAIEPIYRPGDGTVAGTRRSSEFIYRAWKPLMTLVKQAEPAAIALHARFVGEFANELLSGVRGTETEQVARQFCDSFLDIPAGEFQMGSPPEKQGMGEELRDRWRAYIEEDGDPEERAKQHIANMSFTPGKRGQQEQEYWLEWFTEILRDKDLQRLETSQFPKNETPATPVQTVAAFRLCRTPVLNDWFRLFSPGHGESDSSYRDKFEDASPTPDCPVIFVSWYDAWAFSQWARWEEGQCRLPHEYEWEYAAKAGTPWDQNYWWGDEFDETKCNAEKKVGHTTPPVAAHANPWGLQDMLGNVWEWCEDWYYTVYDPNNVEEGSIRVNRGGGWIGSARICRSAHRSGSIPSLRLNYLGFRVALSSSGQEISSGLAQPKR